MSRSNGVSRCPVFSGSYVPLVGLTEFRNAFLLLAQESTIRRRCAKQGAGDSGATK